MREALSEASAASWGLRMLSECALIVAAIVWPQAAPMVTLAALTVGTVGLVAAFVQKRRYYLDERTANKPLQGASNPAIS